MTDWITDFMAYTESVNSPQVFQKWAAISIIAGALERKVWVYTRGSNLYPNLYILLIAPPGIGKTAVTRKVREMLKSLPEHHIAPSSVTKASLIDTLSDAARHVMRASEVPSSIMFNALSISSNELGVLLPAYDNEFMNTLTDLYDGINYSESRRTRDIKIEIKAPNINLIGATTPSYLANMMPEGAWDQGFASRIILVYSGETQLRSLFSDVNLDKDLGDALKDRLKSIGELYGKMSFTEEAAKALDNWYMNDCPPKPDHPKLHHYNTRRIVHVLKLAMVASASEGDALVITMDHVQRALDWLLEAELYMPDIFKEMTGTTHSQLVEEAWYFIYKAYIKNGKKAVVESRIINFLQQRTAAHNVERVLQVMEKSGIIKRAIGKYGNEYIPQGKQD